MQNHDLKMCMHFQLHGPSIFAVKAKIYGVLYNQASSIAFDETSSYWSALKSSWFLGFSLVTTRLSYFHWSVFPNHEGSTFTEKDQNKVNYRIGPLRSDSVIKLVSDLITESDQAVRAVHSCNSWFSNVIMAFVMFGIFPTFKRFDREN